MNYRGRRDGPICYKSQPMIPFFLTFFPWLSAFFRSRYSLSLEILALRQQLCVLKRKHPRPRLRIQDRLFWIFLRRLWPAWASVLVIVKPQTVAAWHRAGFRLFWRLRSRAKRLGRPKLDCTAAEGSLSGNLSLPLRDSGSGRQVWRRGDRFSDRLRHETQTYKPCKPLAEWSRRTLDWKVSPRATRSRHRLQ